jgi:hypothetical protein
MARFHSHRPLPFDIHRCRWCWRAIVPNFEWLYWETKTDRRRKDAQSMEWQENMGKQMAAWRASQDGS